MSHNVSSNRRRAEVMAAALENFNTWDFEVECANCGVRKQLPVADLSQRFGSVPVREVAGRFRYSIPRCGERPHRLVLRRGSYEIVLTGRGTYG